jgi:hypothetical protein
VNGLGKRLRPDAVDKVLLNGIRRSSLVRGGLHSRGKIEVRHGKPAGLHRLAVEARRVVPTG